MSFETIFVPDKKTVLLVVYMSYSLPSDFFLFLCSLGLDTVNISSILNCQQRAVVKIILDPFLLHNPKFL